jgi:hypothetical protein
MIKDELKDGGNYGHMVKKIPSRVKRRKGKELWTLFEDD